MERKPLKLPLKLKIYALGLGGSSFVFLLILSRYFPFSPISPPFLMLFSVAIVLCLFSISLPRGGIQEVPLFPLVTASIILYGPAAGAWLDSLSFFLSTFLHKERRKDLITKDPEKVFFYYPILLLNMGSFNYSAGIAGLVWVYASHSSPAYECYRHIPALFLMGLAYIFVDGLTSSIAGAIMEGAPFWQIWLANRSWNILFAFLEIGLGVLYVLLYYVGGIPLLFLGFSFLMVLRWGYLVHFEKGKIMELFMRMLHEQLEKLDLPTKEHCEMVGRLAEAVGRAMGIPFWRREQLVYAARLHDVGKIAVDEKIIQSPEPLTPQEREEIRRHTSVPYQAMRDVPYLRQVGYWILLHHEKMDGSGYWGRLGKEIPLEAKILGIVDAIHALTSPRPYRRDNPTYTLEEALDILYKEANRGKWDIKVLNTMRAIIRKNDKLRGMLNER